MAAGHAVNHGDARSAATERSNRYRTDRGLPRGTGAAEQNRSPSATIGRCKVPTDRISTDLIQTDLAKVNRPSKHVQKKSPGTPMRQRTRRRQSRTIGPTGIEPAPPKRLDPKSSASASSATAPWGELNHAGAVVKICGSTGKCWFARAETNSNSPRRGDGSLTIHLHPRKLAL